MIFITIKCVKCGYTKEIFESERDMYLYEQDKEKCFICGGEFEVMNNKQTENFTPPTENFPKFGRESIYLSGEGSCEFKEDGIPISEILHAELIERMKHNIETMGNDRTYKVIEGFVNGITRVRHR